MVFGSVFSSSPSAFAVGMGGTMDGGGGNDGNNMPPPEDAPATTDALTAGGGSDNDDDEDDNDVDSGGSRDDDDNDDDNDKDDPKIPEDAPATTNALTAKKIECPPGQEVTLFSTTCEPVGQGSDSTQGATQAATACPPTSSTPTSYGLPDGLSITNAIWASNNNDYEIKGEQRDTWQAFLHQVATPVNPPVTAKDLISNPSLRALCTGEPVTVNKPDGTTTTHDPDGTVTVTNPDGTETAHNPDGTKSIKKTDGNGVATVDSYNADNKLTSSSKLDPSTGMKVQTTEYLPGTRTIASETTFSPIDGKPVLKEENDRVGGMTTRTQYYPGTDRPHKVLELIYDKATGDEREIYTEYTADGGRIIQDLNSNGGTKNTYDKAGTLVKTETLDKFGHPIETK